MVGEDGGAFKPGGWFCCFYFGLFKPIDGKLLDEGVDVVLVNAVVRTIDGYLFDGVGQHIFEGFDLVDDVVDVLLLVLAQDVPVLFDVVPEFRLHLPGLLLVEDARAFLLLVQLLVVHLVLVLDLGNVEHRGQMLHSLCALHNNKLFSNFHL